MTDSGTDPIRVLHVDDDPEFGNLVKTYLERSADALDVTVENSGRNAVTRLAQGGFDCVVSDYNMSDMNGLELLDAVREDHPDLPFVLFTGRGSEEIASEAISAGVTDYLQKGIGTDQYTVLANRITNAVESWRSERALAESKQRYQSLVEKSHDAIFIIQDEMFAFVNDRIRELTGYDPSELHDTHFTKLVHPDDQRRVRQIAERRRTTGDAPETYEHRIRTKSGETRYCELRVQAITHDGEYAVLGFARDISDRKTYARTLERLHDATRELMRAETKAEVCDIAVETARTELGLPITGIWLHDESADRLEPVTATDKSETVVGEPPTFEPGNSLAWTVFDDQRTAVFDDLGDAEQVYDSDTEIRSEVILPLGDEGVLMSGSTDVESFDDLDREFLELLATNTEAALERAEREADRRRLTRELRRSKGKIERLHEIATEIESCESEQQVCDITVEAAERILEFDICVVDIEEDGLLETKSLSSEILEEETPPMSVDEGIAGKTYRTGESYRFDDIHAVPEAKPQADYRSMISVPIGEHGVFQAVADEADFFDETDVELAELLLSHTTEALRRVEREQQLRTRETRLRQQKDRLEEFASIVSHDLRNPLNVAQGNLDVVLDDRTAGTTETTETAETDGPSEHSRLETATTALERMEEIIDDVLTLARQGQVVDNPEPVALETTARQAWASVKTLDATLTVEDDRRLEADSGRLQRLLENLFRNAVEHGATDIAVRVHCIDGGFAVEDDGPGIPADERERVFESAYSTADEGAGFGLAIVDRIAEAHGWTVTVTDGRDGGARFEVRDATERPRTQSPD
jgi:PAS domain S-box-containing protein